VSAFGDHDGPRVYGLPPGANFTAELAAGIKARLAGQPPEALARVEVAINTSRASRALEEAFENAAEAVFLPRITTFERFVDDPLTDAPPAIDGLERRLTLTRLIDRMLTLDPSLGPPGAAGPLADTLARLLDEMHGSKAPLSSLDGAVDDAALAKHWETSLKFLKVLGDGWPAHLAEKGAVDPEARYALATAAKITALQSAPPSHMVLAAGSTGSKRVTSDLLVALASLPQGAVVLPGFDFALDGAGWKAATPDHPQFGYRQLLDHLDLAPTDVRPWTGQRTPGARARVFAEVLRPAPVTHHWLRALPALRADIPAATDAMTLIEAPSPRREAEAVALIMRKALEETTGSVALVTADRNLGRRIAAALGRWGIDPDDSSGRPLALTPPGVFLTSTAALLTRSFDPVLLLALLKHPLSDAPGLEIARMEMDGLRNRDIAHRLTGVAALLTTEITEGPEERQGPLVAPQLAESLSHLLPWAGDERRPLAEWVRLHRTVAEAIASEKLWEEKAGLAASAALERFEKAADAYGEAAASEYPQLLTAALSEAGDVAAEAYLGHPRVSIWGTLEARAQSAETVILGGLNEGVWPAQPAPDPWLNRQMREKIGLNAPERRIGLAAHDFLQAASAPTVYLTRAVKADGAPTTPARWLSRLTTLLEGAEKSALEAMQGRGAEWVTLAEAIDALDASVEPAGRPEPRPPAKTRPRTLSVTEIETLIRDPYSIYAKRILRFRALDEPGAPPDQRLRGETLHAVMERFIKECDPWPGPDAARKVFDRLSDEVIAEVAPPPALVDIWRARLARVAPWIIGQEAERREYSRPIGAELHGIATIQTLLGDFTLTGRADRVDFIDNLPDGGVAIIDYKAGQAPSNKQAQVYAKQLPLLGAMARAGAFDAFEAETAAILTYVSLSGADDGGKNTEIDPDPEAMSGLIQLINAFQSEDEPFLARAAPEEITWASDYEHLSRFGEWSDRVPGDEA
jgi:ATP-dependent helicase/nuclease subunit B